jgi:hypothetical protein
MLMINDKLWFRCRRAALTRRVLMPDPDRARPGQRIVHLLPPPHERRPGPQMLIR